MVLGPSERDAGKLRAGDLLSNLVDFAATLRSDLHFSVGQAQAREALRAIEIVGVSHLGRVRDAIRLIFCAKRSESEVFDEAFDAFFLRPEHGVRQKKYSPRHSRRKDDRATFQSPDTENREGGERKDERPISQSPATREWETLLARYSPTAGATLAPTVTATHIRELLPAADRLVAAVRLGNVRRWRPQKVGPRFDMRRTLRSSLHTGGDPVSLRLLGHPRRNPRFILLIDGSRSMNAHGALMLEFAYALCRRSRRTRVFVFSTQLREVTRELRTAAKLLEHRLSDTGESWGGGTRIGSNLEHIVRKFGSGLDDQTVAIIYSDGLDVGDVRQLERAMRELQRRCAYVVWVNPLAGSPQYRPEAVGMRRALPFVDALIALRDVDGLKELARVVG